MKSLNCSIKTKRLTEGSAKRQTRKEREKKEARAIYNIYKGISVQQYRT